MTTLGTDPELFIQTKEGEPLSMAGLLGGTKSKPLVLGDGYALQEDNVMLEFNTPPMSNARDFAFTVANGLDMALNFVRTKLDDYSLQPLISSGVLFPADQLKDRGSYTFGCAPDFDAYQRGAPAPAVDPERLECDTGAMRYAGGHVHLGYDNVENVPDFVVASLCDAFVGLRSVALGDKQGERRTLYGAAGRYRPTEYGIEYRTLSNFWIASVDKAYDIGTYAKRVGTIISEWEADEIHKLYTSIPWGDVRRFIMEESSLDANRLHSHIMTTLYQEARG